MQNESLTEPNGKTGLDRIRIVLFLSFLILPTLIWGILCLVGRASPAVREFVDEQTGENRTLAGMPDTFDDSFFAEIEECYSDHVPFRTRIFNLYSKGINRLDRVYRDTFSPPLVYVFTGEKGRIMPVSRFDMLYGRNGWLFYLGDTSLADYLGEETPTEDEFDLTIRVLTDLNALCREKGKRLILLIAPNKERVYSEYMPYYLSVCPVKRVDRLTETIRESVGIPVLYPYEALLRAKADYMGYYRHDTHWNAMGGLVGAEELRLSLGMAPYALSADAVTEFRPPSGDLVALGGLDPDEYADDVDYRIDYRPNVTVTESPCPDAPLVQRFTASEGSDERFCLVGDSFREALVPFLSRDFKTSTFVHHDAIAAAAEDVRQADVLVLESVERYTPDLPYYVYILINLLLEE